MNREVVVFAGGCFWCTEALFRSLRGIISVTSGYTGGTVANPSYEQVSSGETGHAEAVRIEYDPAEISFDDLLAVFFNTHNPTTRNQQGADIGTQYRSAIFYSTPGQREKAEALIRELDAAKAYDKPVVTEVLPLGAFYAAEGYHQDYYQSNRSAPYCELVIAPKLEKLEHRFADLLKK